MTVRTLRLIRNMSLHSKDAAFCPMKSVAPYSMPYLNYQINLVELRRGTVGAKNKKAKVSTKNLKLKIEHKTLSGQSYHRTCCCILYSLEQFLSSKSSSTLSCSSVVCNLHPTVQVNFSIKAGINRYKLKKLLHNIGYLSIA